MSLHNKVYCRDPPDVKYVKMCVGSECTGADPGILENGGGGGGGGGGGRVLEKAGP